MASNWTKVTHDIEDKREVIQIAGLTGLDSDAVLGKLIRIWIWADKETIDGYVRGVTSAFLDTKARHSGFAKAMKAAGWLGEDEGGIRIPNFDRHMSESAKKRALAVVRMQNSRANRDEDVTPPAQQKRKQKCNASISSSNTPSINSLRGGVEGVLFPPALDTPECRAAWDEWLAHKHDIGKPYKTARSQSQKLKELSTLGPERFVAAVRHSIGEEWQGIHEKKEYSGTGRRRSNTQGTMDAVREIIEGTQHAA
jgi:hypothetical protein